MKRICTAHLAAVVLFVILSLPGTQAQASAAAGGDSTDDAGSVLEVTEADGSYTYLFSVTQELAAVTQSLNGESADVSVHEGGIAISNPLKGALFGLYETAEVTEDHAYVLSGELTRVRTDATGFVRFTDLEEGTYYLKQISAPFGYASSDEVYRIGISAKYESEGGRLVRLSIEITNLDTGETASSFYRYAADEDGLTVLYSVCNPVLISCERMIRLSGTLLKVLSGICALIVILTAHLLYLQRYDKAKKGGKKR